MADAGASVWIPAIIAAAGVGVSAAQSEESRRQQAAAQRQQREQDQRQEQVLRSQQDRDNRALQEQQAKSNQQRAQTVDTASIMERIRRGAQGGNASTLLTGPQGVNSNQIPLGGQPSVLG